MVYTSREQISNLLGITEQDLPSQSAINEIADRKSRILQRQLNKSFETQTITNQYLYIDDALIENYSYNFFPYIAWKLRYTNVKNLSSEAGDKLEIFNYATNSFNDWLTDDTKQEGRGRDYYIDEEQGKLFIRLRRIRDVRDVRVSFRVGYDTTHPEFLIAQEIVTKEVIIDILKNYSQSVNLTISGNDGESLSKEKRIEIYKDEVWQLKESITDIKIFST